MSEKNIWLLVSGPSGVGKTTVIERMLGEFYPRLQPVVTCTTREIREGERDGVSYHFLTREEFLKKQKAGKFLETIERHGVLYGTLREEVEKKLAAGCDLITPIDWQGRRKLAVAGFSLPIVSVFLKPASMEELRKRLDKRGRNTPEELRARLEMAEVELSHAAEYDYEFVSTTQEKDFARVRGIYKEARGER